jgi:hypothetical protein
VVLKYRDGQYSLMGRARLNDGTQADTDSYTPNQSGPYSLSLTIHP